MHFPLFQISLLFPTNLSDSVENFPNLTFSRKISRFSSAKISDDLFLSHRLKILIPHLFSLFHYISPYFAKIIIPPTFANFLLSFREIYVFSTYFMCISFPSYFDHDAFLHHTMRVVDAPANWQKCALHQRSLGRSRTKQKTFFQNTQTSFLLE